MNPLAPPTRLKQLHLVSRDGFGDCWRTAIACLLQLSDPSEVPIFGYDPVTKRPTDNQMGETMSWLHGRGLMIDWQALETREAVEAYSGPCILSGYTDRTRPNGKPIRHCVVRHADGTIHDPHPDDTGLLVADYGYRVSLRD